VPHRRKRPDEKRPDRGVRSHVALLEEFISQHTGLPAYGRRWVKEWLLCPSASTLIPPEAPVTLIEGLRMLFEYPYGTIVYRLGCQMKVRFNLVVAIGDKDATKVLVIHNDRILQTFTHRPDKFRFHNRTELEQWMVETATEIRDAFRRNPR
jgi:hypothetical protein